MSKSGANPYAGSTDLVDYKDRILSLNEEIETIKGEMGAKIKEVMKSRGEVYKEAKEAGVNSKALKAVVKKINYQNRADACGEDLEDEDRDHFDWQQQELGMLADTPLGQAATAAAEKAKKTKAGKAAGLQ